MNYQTWLEERENQKPKSPCKFKVGDTVRFNNSSIVGDVEEIEWHSFGGYYFVKACQIKAKELMWDFAGSARQAS